MHRLNVVVAVICGAAIILLTSSLAETRQDLRMARSILGSGFIPFAELVDSGGERIRTDQQVGITQMTVIVVTSPSCSYCEASYSAWARLSSAAKKHQHRFIVVATENPAEQRLELVRAGISDPVWTPTRRQYRAELWTSTTPQIAIADSQGRIVDGVIGALVKPTRLQELLTLLERE